MEQYISITKSWIESFVVGLQLCPFAANPFRQEKIHYRVSRADNFEALMEDLILELHQLDQTEVASLETTLLIHPFIGVSFDHYLDLVEVANQILNTCGLEGVVQIATFHPDYQFARTQKKDVSNFTNRSPYPMMHLLREASVSEAIKNYPNVEAVPRENIKKLKEMGIDKISERWLKLFG